MPRDDRAGCPIIFELSGKANSVQYQTDGAFRNVFANFCSTLYLTFTKALMENNRRWYPDIFEYIKR